MKYNVDVATRADADSTETIRTHLTVDFTGANDAVVHALAIAQIKVLRQSYWRKHGIPSNDVFLVKDYKSGVRAAPSIESLFASMPAEERKAFLEKQLAALS